MSIVTSSGSQFTIQLNIRDPIRWTEGWHSQRQLHSTISYNSPIEFEAMFSRRGHGVAA
jgi:hypothetical protein